MGVPVTATVLSDYLGPYYYHAAVRLAQLLLPLPAGEGRYGLPPAKNPPGYGTQGVSTKWSRRCLLIP
jgi:hypothetical protein